MNTIKTKKNLGQHFLKDKNIAKKIVKSLKLDNYKRVLEIGPGKGILTEFILEKEINLDLVELDKECINYLVEKYPEIKNKIINQDFLKLDLNKIFKNDSFAIIGNFPYNISSQIIFRILDYRDKIPYMTGMFQKEVAERICHFPGSKKYGILSVLTQLFYKTKYLFSVNPSVFDPQPKVKSGVIELTRKKIFKLNCNENLLFKIIKLSFQQRRKTLRNSLKILDIPFLLREDAIFDKRPEKLSGKEFIEITKKISNVNS
jgi:16S rRNA (adenine1518-N6/adenine1519-N6)-dimethyltransferase